jgi:Immunoglobulin-like domain of bacterial spore germination/Sporulation and spore germination
MNAEDRLKQMMDAAHAESSATGAEWNQFVHRAHRSLYARRAAAALGAVAVIGIGAFAANAFMSDDLSPAPLPPVSSPTVEPEPTQPPEPTTAEVALSEAELWYVGEERLSWTATAMGGEASLEVAGDDPAMQRAAFWFGIALGEPLGAVQEVGETTAIPPGTKLLHVSQDGSVLNVDLSSEFGSGGGSLSMQLRVAQVVYTGTQFEGVDSVQILIEGQQQDALGGEGIDISGPLTRRDFQDFAPNIVVETPKPGQYFASGDTIAGFANVFEANVNWRVLDQDGNVLDEGFATATCGTGCWGDFEITPEFDNTEAQVGRIEVLTFSAEDGSEQDVVSIPVELGFPGGP